MKTKDIRLLTIQDLTDKKAETRLELMKMNSQVASGTALKKPGQIRTYKKTIAKINLVIQEKEGKNNK